LIFSVVLISGKYLGAVTGGVQGVLFAKILICAIFSILLIRMACRIFFRDQKAAPLERSTKKIVDRYAVQYMITNGIWAIFMLNDIMLLSIFHHDPAVVADYKVAYFLPGNLSIISGAVGMFVAPYFVKNESDPKWIMRNYRKTLLVSAGLIALAIVVLSVFAKPIVALFFGDQYLNTVPLLRLLLIASFANSGIRLATANILAAMGQIRYNMIVSIVGVILQIGMNLLIIPVLGVIGVAITSITVYIFMAISLVIVFVSKYRTVSNENL
jgi:O-antigen/teichoic acid export membrane protein